MEFNHRSYEKGQTIAAIATPPGEGGIAIIRITGDLALSVADQIFSGPIHKYKSHTVHFGHILGTNQEILDEGLAVVMKNPGSYTGEDTVEIHCHGGALITRKVLDAALSAGARAALPGEFTFKAFQNGKIDLTKAEAVQQVISSKSELAWQAAKNHLEGRLHKKIALFQKNLLDIAAILEAWVDFPEEGLEFASQEEVQAQLENLIESMSALHESFYDGQSLKSGFSLCLIGAPNAGKSSLMNALCGKERAIVTNIPGTTRDLLEADIQFAGLSFKLVDTAGIRFTDEQIEKEGVRRSEKAAQEADMVLLVYDYHRPIHIDIALPKEKTIVIWNKIDLDQGHKLHLPYPHQVDVSAKKGTGIEALKQKIHTIIWRKAPPSKEEIIISSERHHQALGKSIEALQSILNGLRTEVSPEFLTSDMRLALKELGTIIGMNVTEEVLGAIFSKFCVGK